MPGEAERKTRRVIETKIKARRKWQKKIQRTDKKEIEEEIRVANVKRKYEKRTGACEETRRKINNEERREIEGGPVGDEDHRSLGDEDHRPVEVKDTKTVQEEDIESADAEEDTERLGISDTEMEQLDHLR